MPVELEVRFMIWLQSKHGRITDFIAIFFHYLLKEEVVFFSCPLLIWIWSIPFGTSDLILACTTEVVNGILKWIFQQPRPVWIHPEIKNLRGAWEKDYSTPSSHSQIVASLATYALWNLWQYPWVSIFAVLITMCVGLSRVYLGVHFPHDIVFGWAVGICLGALFGIFEPVNWLIDQPLYTSLPISFLFPMILFGILFVEQKFLPGRDPESIEQWENQARSALPEGKIPTEKEKLHPRDITRYTFQLAFIFGCSVAMSLIKYLPQHETLLEDCTDTSRIWIYVVRVFMGLCGLVFFFGLKEWVKKKKPINKDVELSEASLLLKPLKVAQTSTTRIMEIAFCFVVDVSSVFFAILLLPVIFEKSSLGCV